MDRQMRREYFERIYQLRSRYERLGPADTTSVISIDAIIAMVNRLMIPVGAAVVVADPKPAGN